MSFFEYFEKLILNLQLYDVLITVFIVTVNRVLTFIQITVKFIANEQESWLRPIKSTILQTNRANILTLTNQN